MDNKFRKVYLKCESVEGGMFDNEYAVEVLDIKGKKISLFAYHSLVSDDKRFLEVILVGEMDMVYYVVLPDVPFEDSGVVIAVPKEMIFELTEDKK
jgi:hypothetical protein